MKNRRAALNWLFVLCLGIIWGILGTLWATQGDWSKRVEPWHINLWRRLP